MAKILASLAALVLYGSLGAASTDGGVNNDSVDASGPLDRVVIAETKNDENVNGLASTPAATSSGGSRPYPMSGISPEERERREAVCERQWLDCCNRCNRRFRARDDIRICKDECGEKNAECMKEIPN